MIVRHRTPVTTSGAFDRAFEQLTAGLFSTAGPARRLPARVPDVVANWQGESGAESLVLTVDLPGVSAEAVSVEVAGRTLTLAAQTDHLQWSRSLQLGASLDPDSIEARHVDGRLTVRIAPVEAPATRSIAIDTRPDTSADHIVSIETTSPPTEEVQANDTTSGGDQPAA